MALTTALNATSQRRCGDETGLTVAAMKKTHINTDTKYATLQHIPSRRASLWAVGGRPSKHEAHAPGRLREGRAALGSRGKNTNCIRRANRGIDIEHPRDIEEMFGWRAKPERKTRLVSTSSPLIGYTGPTSTRYCGFYSFVVFFDDDDYKRLTLIWEGIGQLDSEYRYSGGRRRTRSADE